MLSIQAKSLSCNLYIYNIRFLLNNIRNESEALIVVFEKYVKPWPQKYRDKDALCTIKISSVTCDEELMTILKKLSATTQACQKDCKSTPNYKQLVKLVGVVDSFVKCIPIFEKYMKEQLLQQWYDDFKHALARILKSCTQLIHHIKYKSMTTRLIITEHDMLCRYNTSNTNLINAYIKEGISKTQDIYFGASEQAYIARHDPNEIQNYACLKLLWDYFPSSYQWTVSNIQDCHSMIVSLQNLLNMWKNPQLRWQCAFNWIKTVLRYLKTRTYMYFSQACTLGRA